MRCLSMDASAYSGQGEDMWLTCAAYTTMTKATEMAATKTTAATNTGKRAIRLILPETTFS